MPASVRDHAAAVDDVGRPVGVPDRRPARQVQAARAERRVGQRLPAVHRGIADDLCFIKTMHTEHVNHDPASKFLHTGFQLAGRPSAGAWVSYALGSDNRDLPNYVVMNSGDQPGRAARMRRSGAPGFLPSHHQGVEFRSGDDPVLYLNNPEGTRGPRPARAARRARKARGRPADAVEGPRHPVARQPVRDGVSDAGVGARGRRHLGRAASTCSRCTVPTCRSRGRSRATACSPAGWPNAA